RIKRWIVCKRQDFSGGRPDYDNLPCARPCGPNSLGQRLLDMTLNYEVNCKTNVSSRCRIFDRMIVGLIQRINIQKKTTSLTTNRFIVCQFDSTNSTLVNVNEPQHVRGVSAANVKPFHLVNKPKPRESKLFDSVNFFVVEFAFNGYSRSSGC